jgi:hypothetical protein
MKRRTTLAAVTLALALAGCKKEPVSARVDPAVAPLLPSDTVVLAGIRLDKLQKTPFFDRYVTGEKALRFFQDFQKRTGIDVRKDLWEVAIAMTPRGQIAFARGKFGGQFGLEPRIDMPGMTRLSHKGYPILATKDAGVTFFNTGVAVAGQVDLLKMVIDNRDKPGESIPTRALALVEKIPARAHFWVVSPELGTLMPKTEVRGMEGNFLRMAQTAGEMSAWADLASGVELEAELLYPDEAMAAQVRDALKALLGILRLKTPNDQTELLQVYSNIFPSSTGPKVKVTAKTPFALIDQAVGRLSKAEGAE